MFKQLFNRLAVASAILAQAALCNPAQDVQDVAAAGIYNPAHARSAPSHAEWKRQSNNNTATPKNYGMLLFRGWEMLDVYGPLNTLGLLSRLYTQVNLYLISETMDPVTTAPTMAAMNPFNSSVWPTINPTHTFQTVPDDLEVLIIPGGLGTRSPYLNTTLDWVTQTYPKLRYLITVCTGSLLLSRTGLLDGRNATTNKNSFLAVKAASPKVNWIPEARWVVDGNIWSSSGISAGIDATLAFVEFQHGNATATKISNLLEYERHADPSWDPFSQIFNLTSSS